MTPEQLNQQRGKLNQERARLTSELNGNVAIAKSDTEAGESNELADYDPNDPADNASELYDRTRMGADSDNLRSMLAKIDRALAKIDDGTYGLSDVNGAPIPEERLLALPYAATTADQEDAI